MEGFVNDLIINLSLNTEVAGCQREIMFRGCKCNQNNKRYDLNHDMTEGEIRS